MIFWFGQKAPFLPSKAYRAIMKKQLKEAAIQNNKAQ